MPIAGLTGIFEENPTWRTVEFAGRHINLSALGRSVGLSKATISRYFNGTREPKMGVLIKMAAVLGVTLDEFDEALTVRLKKLKTENETLVNQYLDRVNREMEEDLKAYQEGRVPEPRLPGMRVKLSA